MLHENMRRWARLMLLNRAPRLGIMGTAIRSPKILVGIMIRVKAECRVWPSYDPASAYCMTAAVRIDDLVGI
jgi:hypothetical protein